MPAKYKSNFEKEIATWLKARGISFSYEGSFIEFTQPAIKRKYIPDWEFGKKGIFYESKGRLTASDRKKYEWVKQSNPKIKLRFIFMRATEKIRKGSKTSYSDWAEKNGFEWCDFRRGIPEKWLK